VQVPINCVHVVLNRGFSYGSELPVPVHGASYYTSTMMCMDENKGKKVQSEGV
jgi:hypothetical protein